MYCSYDYSASPTIPKRPVYAAPRSWREIGLCLMGARGAHVAAAYRISSKSTGGGHAQKWMSVRRAKTISFAKRGTLYLFHPYFFKTFICFHLYIRGTRYGGFGNMSSIIFHRRVARYMHSPRCCENLSLRHSLIRPRGWVTLSPGRVLYGRTV